MNLLQWISREKLYELAEWLVTGMTLIFGFKYLKQIINWIFGELYRLLIEQHMWPV